MNLERAKKEVIKAIKDQYKDLGWKRRDRDNLIEVVSALKEKE